MHAGAGIAGNEIWFHTYPRRVEARVNEFLAGKFRADQKKIDLLRPRLREPVNAKHSSHGGRGQPRAAITTMRDRAKERMGNAVFADVAITEEIAPGAEKPVVVQRLDYGNTDRPARVIRGGRDQRKCVVKVSDVRQFTGENIAQFTMGAPRPRGAPAEAGFLDKGILLDLIVVPQIFKDFMPRSAQEPDFRLANAVFASGALIEVVRDKNLHETSFSKIFSTGQAAHGFSPSKAGAVFFRGLSAYSAPKSPFVTQCALFKCSPANTRKSSKTFHCSCSATSHE